MKKIYAVFFILICFCFNSYAQKDVPTLEAIISGHKTNRKVLDERKNKSAANAVLAENIRSITAQYEDIEKKISQKIKIGYNSIEFAFEVSNILQEIAKTPGLIQEFYILALNNNVKNPLLFKYYQATYKGIKSEIERCQKTIAFGVVVSGNMKEKYDVLMEIKSVIQSINYHLNNSIYMARGLSSIDMRFTESFYKLISTPEFKRKEAEIRDKIITEYSQ